MADIPEIENLQELYLKNFDIDIEKINLNGLEKYNNTKFDLVISNHALCELDKNLQDKYITLINNSAYGYITYDSQVENNSIKQYGGYILNDLINNKLNKKCEVSYNSYAKLPIITWKK